MKSARATALMRIAPWASSTPMPSSIAHNTVGEICHVDVWIDVARLLPGPVVVDPPIDEGSQRWMEAGTQLRVGAAGCGGFEQKGSHLSSFGGA